LREGRGYKGLKAKRDLKVLKFVKFCLEETIEEYWRE
jgi:hypothetical protein